jgi:FkbM family methyltransferase
VHAIERVLDVGAWTGGFPRTLRGVGFEGPIASFEPVQQSFEELSAAAADDSAWEAHRLALGERDGDAEIGVPERSDFASFQRPSEYAAALPGAPAAPERHERVELRRLDSIWDELVPPGEGALMLKIDTQGYDRQVIEGAGERLAEVAVLQLELAVMPLYKGVAGWLEQLDDLAASSFAPSGLFPVTRDPMLRLVELDAVLVRADVDHFEREKPPDWM